MPSSSRSIFSNSCLSKFSPLRVVAAPSRSAAAARLQLSKTQRLRIEEVPGYRGTRIGYWWSTDTTQSPHEVPRKLVELVQRGCANPQLLRKRSAAPLSKIEPSAYCAAGANQYKRRSARHADHGCPCRGAALLLRTRVVNRSHRRLRFAVRRQECSSYILADDTRH
jgi:hypothetical protein